MTKKEREARRRDLDHQEARAKAQFDASLVSGKEACRKFDVVRQKARDAADTGSFEPITGVIDLPHALAHR